MRKKKALKFDCRAGAQEDEKHTDRAIYQALRHSWFYVDVDPRSGQGYPLVPLGTSPERIDNAIEVTHRFNDTAKDPDAPGHDPRAVELTITLRDAEFQMIKETWGAWQGRKGHPAHAEFFKAVNDKLDSAVSVEED